MGKSIGEAIANAEETSRKTWGKMKMKMKMVLEQREGGTTTWVDMKNKVVPWVEPASV